MPLPPFAEPIAAELVLISAILVATAALGTTPPPRVPASSADEHAGHAREPGRDTGPVITIAKDGRSAEVVLHSARAGINDALTIRDATGRALDAQEVTFIAENVAASVEPIRRDAEKTGPAAGAWTACSSSRPANGRSVSTCW